MDGCDVVEVSVDSGPPQHIRAPHNRAKVSRSGSRYENRLGCVISDLQGLADTREGGRPSGSKSNKYSALSWRRHEDATGVG